jgi:hypothetical protein
VTPPIILQDKTVEVTSINPLMKTYSVVVKVSVKPLELHTLRVQSMIVKKVARATNYLVMEGFIPDPSVNKWKINIVGIAE